MAVAETSWYSSPVYTVLTGVLSIPELTTERIESCDPTVPTCEADDGYEVQEADEMTLTLFCSAPSGRDSLAPRVLNCCQSTLHLYHTLTSALSLLQH